MPALLFLALDGVDTTRVAAWADDLPALASLVESGSSVVEPRGLPGAFWSSLYAGAGPARHGVWQVAHTPSVTPFWATWTQGGRSCAAVDLPHMPVVPEAGTQIANWGLDRTPPEAFGTWPSSLVREVHAQVGLPRRVPPVLSIRDPDGVHFVRDELLARIEWKERLLDWVQAAQAPEVLCFGFDEARTAGLHLRHTLDPTHPRHAACGATHAVREVYEHLDAMVARWLQRPARAHVALMRGTLAPPAAVGRFLPALVRVLGSRSSVPAHRSWRWRVRRWWSGATDEGRRCRAVENDAPFGAVRIHLVGRDAGARLRADVADAMLDDLTAGLLALERTNGGGCPILRVLRTDDLHDGPQRDVLPDLLIEWDTTVPTEGVQSARVGTMSWPADETRSGMLAPGATLAARGVELPDEVAIEDVADLLSRHAT